MFINTHVKKLTKKNVTDIIDAVKAGESTVTFAGCHYQYIIYNGADRLTIELGTNTNGKIRYTNGILSIDKYYQSISIVYGQFQEQVKYVMPILYELL